MKLKDLKKQLDKLSKEQLEQELSYNSEEFCISGIVKQLKRAKGNLYYTGEDDPAQLYTRKQLVDEGFEKEDIDSFTIEIKKGELFLEL
jgi:hypothetical protein